MWIIQSNKIRLCCVMRMRINIRQRGQSGISVRYEGRDQCFCLNQIGNPSIYQSTRNTICCNETQTASNYRDKTKQSHPGLWSVANHRWWSLDRTIYRNKIPSSHFSEILSVWNATLYHSFCCLLSPCQGRCRSTERAILTRWIVEKFCLYIEILKLSFAYALNTFCWSVPA